MVAGAQRPQVPTVVTPKTNGGVTITSRVTQAYPKVPLTEAHVSTPSALARTLNLMQENADASSKAERSNPHRIFYLASKIAMVSGQNVTIKHGLGVAFTGYEPLRAYSAPIVTSGSSPFAAVDAPYNGGKDPSQYLVLQSGCTGTYDIKVLAS